MRTTRRTGALWFLNYLWDYYAASYKKPGISNGDTCHILMDTSIFDAVTRLPLLRQLYALHLRSLRKAKLHEAWAQANYDLIHKSIPGHRGPLANERNRLGNLLRKTRPFPRLCAETLMLSIYHNKIIRNTRKST